MSNIEYILGLAVIANLITHWFRPIQKIKNLFLLFISSKVLAEILTCPKCLGLYLGVLSSFFVLPYTSPFFSTFEYLTFGALVSFCSYLIKFLIDKIEHYYE